MADGRSTSGVLIDRPGKRTTVRESDRTRDLIDGWVGRRIRTRHADPNGPLADTGGAVITITAGFHSVDLTRTTRALERLTLLETLDSHDSCNSDGHTYSPCVTEREKG